MKYLTFSNGDLMPALGLGTWKSAKGEIYSTIRTALEIGYRHFDCAFIYDNEREIGQAFADALKNNEVKREDLWITSKLWNNRHRTEDVQPAIEKSLRLLQVEYLDLYLIHWPIALVRSVNYPQKAEDMISLNDLPLSQTWQAMIDMKTKGLTRHIGLSNFSIKKISALRDETGVMPEALQIELQPFLQQKNLLNYAQQNNIALTGFCPLGSADRPASRISPNEPKLFENETILTLAQEKDCTPAQVMLAWAVNRGTSVVPKSVHEHRLRENLAAAEIVLSAEQMERMTQLDQHYRYIKGDFWCLEGSDYTVENLWDE
ncbi:aldo/keto reductase [Emticicia sp. TH156]|uniref:aldo/keto reductase n=1 Tax=Emticicia sp. TH156 TaxID=2067454 RepID=UPI000C780EA3|nr:aldo/keto reductase [Emticicia sp. TH156]PLK44698.1 aldehyde oxidoreductase [Emticicia sp. TH156]